MIIAHSPLAAGFKGFALHTHAELEGRIWAVDVAAQEGREPCAQRIVQSLPAAAWAQADWLILSDVFGASPFFVASALAEQLGPQRQRHITGASAPMLLRACTYIDLPLPELAAKALEGAQRGAILLP